MDVQPVLNYSWQAVLALWEELGMMAPFLLFGFLAAGAISVFLPAERVQAHLGGKGFGSIAKATLLGIPLPLCSCSVIPVAASLARHGASKGATAAFLLSTPQTGVDSILVTLSLLGPLFAVFRPLAALLSGLVGGLLISLLVDRGAGKEATGVEPCREICCSKEGSPSRVVRALRYGFLTLPRDIGRPLLLGLVIAGVITVLVPDDFFARHLGSGLSAMVVMMLVGLPVYVCATASVPIAAALIAKGVSPGAALVFLTTGPATNAATVATIWKIMGFRTAVTYLVTVAATALLSGFALDALFTTTNATVAPIAREMLPLWFRSLCAVALLAVLLPAILPEARPKAEAPGTETQPECCSHKEHHEHNHAGHTPH